MREIYELHCVVHFPDFIVSSEKRSLSFSFSLQSKEHIMEKFDRIKQHISTHKTEYLMGIGFATITCLIMRGCHAGVLRVPDGLKTADTSVTVQPLSFFSNRPNFHTVISANRQGPPSWVVRCLETDQVFTSQLNAAKAMNISPANLSSHLNGKYADVSGYHFERLAIAA